MPRPNGRTAGERDGDTERRILDAARKVFVRRGTSGARMQEIAEEAGVNQALLHYYFQTKEGLAAAVFRATAGRLLPVIVEIFGSEAPLERKVEQFVQLYIDEVRQSPFIPGYIVSELHFHPDRMASLAIEIAGTHPAAVMRDYLRRLGAQIDQRVQEGAMRRIAPEQFLVNLMALSVFPFLARPMLGVVFGMDDDAFGRFLDERRAELPSFILNALRP